MQYTWWLVVGAGIFRPQRRYESILDTVKHYKSAISSQIPCNSSVCSPVIRDKNKNHQNSASLALCGRNPSVIGEFSPQKACDGESVPWHDVIMRK